MNLFELVASLTLDDKEYSTALRAAEAKAKGFDGDAEGTISANNEYSDAISEAETDSIGFNGNTTTGDILGNNEGYAEEIGESEKLSEDFDKNVSTGDIEGNNEKYEDEIEDAKGKGADFEQTPIEGVIEGDANDFNEAIGEAQQGATDFGNEFSDMTAKLGAALTAAGIVSAIKAISGAFQEAINDAAQYADSVDKGSDALSMSKKAYQEWSYALSQSGASIDTIKRGWMNLTDALHTSKTNLEEWAEDSSDLKQALQAVLGTDAIDLRNFETTEEAFDTIMRKLADLRASGVDTDWMTKAIFGARGGTQLNDLLNGGAEGIDALIKEANELGLVMSDKDIAGGVAFNDAVSAMNQAVDALKQNIVAGLFPLRTDAARSIANLVSTFNGRTQLSAYNELTGVWEDLNVSLEEVDEKEGVAKTLLKNLAELTDSSGHVQGNFEKWKAYAERLTELFPSLNPMIDTQNGYIKTSTEELEKNIEQQAKYEKLGIEYPLKGVPAMDKKILLEKKEKILDGIRARRNENH